MQYHEGSLSYSVHKRDDLVQILFIFHLHTCTHRKLENEHVCSNASLILVSKHLSV